MPSIRTSALSLIVATLILQQWALPQFGGSRAGVHDADSVADSFAGGKLPMLKPDVAEAYITVDGTAEIRVRPTQIRVVLAVTSQAETAQLCRQEIGDKVRRLRADWKGQGLGDDHVVEDFIAVLPRFEWQQEKQETREILVERKIGYRMQSNLHVAVANDRAAQAAIDKAFELGVTDIIAFDYGSDGLDAAKDQARTTALKAAKSKSEQMLSVVMKGEPIVINVQEHTSVHYPESLYKSFTNVANDELTVGWRDNVPRVHAHRPKNTYYRGLTQQADVQPSELPMQSEITVVSTVRLYFASPAFGKRNQSKSDSALDSK